MMYIAEILHHNTHEKVVEVVKGFNDFHFNIN